MKVNNNTQQDGKPSRLRLPLNELMHTLKEVDLNLSWKGLSGKLNKTKAPTPSHHTKHAHPNCMTEHDVERLFQKSNPKLKMKTETNKPRPEHPPGENTFESPNRDYTMLKFLQLEDEYDKYLSGMPPLGKENENPRKEGMDLTLKFKENYMVGKVIGQGAYAVVRAAVFRPQNRKIAIKAYEKSKIREIQRKKTVRREIRILQSLSHPNIVKLLDVVETNNHLNIIMEYLPGVSLGIFLRQQPHQRFAESTCRHIVRQLAEALRYLHQRSIAHRDIKLENIILDERQSPKLIDFGFSTCIEQPTKVRIFCGTPSYMAPQIVQKKDYRGEAADIWALGVMTFVMLVGYFPFKGTSDEELYRKINAAEFPRNDLLAHKQASSLIQSMFAVDPDQRITAEGILKHPWLTKPKETSSKKGKNDLGELCKFLSKSKERKSSGKHEDPSKRKHTYNVIYAKPLSTNKHSATTLNNTLNRTAKIERGTKLHGEEKSHSNKKPKGDPSKAKAIGFLKLDLRVNSEQKSKSKCKSHRV